MVATVAQSYLFALFIFLLHGLEGGKQTTSTRALVDYEINWRKRERERFLFFTTFKTRLPNDSSGVVNKTKKKKQQNLGKTRCCWRGDVTGRRRRLQNAKSMWVHIKPSTSTQSSLAPRSVSLPFSKGIYKQSRGIGLQEQQQQQRHGGRRNTKQT